MDRIGAEDAELTLDPGDWHAFRTVAHAAVDDAVTRIASLREGPVWQPMPDAAQERFRQPLPITGAPLEDVYAEVATGVLPFAMGNVHPRFFSWYMGASDIIGALGDFLAAVDGSNLGGGDTAAAALDRQVTDWIRQMMGFPVGSSAALVSGGSMANIIALTAARNAMAGVDLRLEGLDALPRPLAVYASDQVHSCHKKAMNLLGLGLNALRRVPSDADYRMDLQALRQMIQTDMARGIRPACVIATAGTTNTGSIDDLNGVADLCRDLGIWMHVDGCIGALMTIAPRNAHLVAGIERADSLAMDLHKWLHAPFDVGCVLMRDARLHRETFAEEAEYLEQAERGLAAAEFLHHYTLETTRGFRALKVWMMLKHHGVDRFGALIDQNIAQSRYLADQIAAAPDLELLAPVPISIVCFRFNPGGLDDATLNHLNQNILFTLQEKGIAAPSSTTLHGRYALRVALCNHRTRLGDLDLLVMEVRRRGWELWGQGRSGRPCHEVN